MATNSDLKRWYKVFDIQPGDFVRYDELFSIFCYDATDDFHAVNLGQLNRIISSLSQNFVDLTSEQIVSGLKTFSAGLVITDFSKDVDGKIDGDGILIRSKNYYGADNGPTLELSMLYGPPVKFKVDSNYNSFSYSNSSTNYSEVQLRLPSRSGEIALAGSGGSLSWSDNNDDGTAVAVVVALNMVAVGGIHFSQVVPLNTEFATGNETVTILLKTAAYYQENLDNTTGTISYYMQRVTLNASTGELVSYGMIHDVTETGVNFNPHSSPSTNVTKIVTVVGAPAEYHQPYLSWLK